MIKSGEKKTVSAEIPIEDYMKLKTYADLFGDGKNLSNYLRRVIHEYLQITKYRLMESLFVDYENDSEEEN